MMLISKTINGGQIKMHNEIVLFGAGAIGEANVRRVSAVVDF